MELGTVAVYFRRKVQKWPIPKAIHSNYKYTAPIFILFIKNLEI